MSTFHKEINRSRWNKIRLQVLNRDQWRCRGILDNGERCNRSGILEVDHIIPISQDNSEKNKYSLKSLQTLCRNCHFAKTRRENNIAQTPPEALAWKDLVNSML